MALSELTWPTDLPQKPRYDSYTEKQAKNVIVTEFDQGPRRVRKMTSAGLETRSVTYNLTSQEHYESMKEFLTLSEGRSFWWPNPQDESQYIYARVSAGTQPEIKAVSTRRYTIKIDIEVWPFIPAKDRE